MIQLQEISEYVQKTAEIIASVLDMEVIICDSGRFLLGDSDPDLYPESKRIETSSVLNVVMNTREAVILKSIDDNPGCVICENRPLCDVKAIIGLPINYQDQAIGAIGILATSLESKQKLMDKKDYFLDFIRQMSDQLISKLMEREANIRLRRMQEQLACIIDSIDSGIIATDDSGRIIHYNTPVFQFFDPSLIAKDGINVSELLEESYINGVITANESFRNKEIILRRNGHSVYALLSSKSIIFESLSIGAIFILKKISDVYRDMDDLNDSGIISGFDAIIGSSPQITEVKHKAAIIARGNSTVLIQGESGTGKELFARALHNSSSFSGKPFIAVNCAAIPDTLLESELFGYEEGAFTGAKKGGKIGKFQLANDGTLFLDEIGEMPFLLQTKLLRVLQERCIERVGGNESIPINVRMIAATNKDLEALVQSKDFREDLFYRLNVIPLTIPPLRERPSDILPLLQHFLTFYNRKLVRDIKGFTQDAERILLNSLWKGNVRELQNAVEYAVNMAGGEYIGVRDINISASNENPAVEHVAMHIESMDELMRKQIIDALQLYGTSVQGKTMAAKTLGLSVATLYRKMKQFRISLQAIL